jgi:hypothetical protein
LNSTAVKNKLPASMQDISGPRDQVVLERLIHSDSEHIVNRDFRNFTIRHLMLRQDFVVSESRFARFSIGNINGKSRSLLFSRCEFESGFKISGAQGINEITFLDCEFKGDVRLFGMSLLGKGTGIRLVF